MSKGAETMYTIRVEAPLGVVGLVVGEELANAYLLLVLGFDDSRVAALTAARDRVVAEALANAEKPVIKPLKGKGAVKTTKASQYEPRECALPECHNIFQPKRVDQRYCSREHAKRDGARAAAERKNGTTGGPIDVRPLTGGGFEVSVVAGEGVTRGAA